MRLYFDSEFTGLNRNADLISIAFVDEFNNKFYAEFTDFNSNKADKWVKENVIDKLILNNHANCSVITHHISQSPYDNEDDITYVRGDKDFIRNTFLEWSKSMGMECTEIISDVCHYDMVFLIDLLSPTGALDVPFIPSTCRDINQDIAAYFNISLKDAFNINRENLVKFFYGDLIKSVNDKHNCLHDADVISAIYKAVAPTTTNHYTINLYDAKYDDLRRRLYGNTNV